MSGVAAESPWFVAGPHRFVPGYVHGRRQPSVVVSLRCQGLAVADMPKYAELNDVWREVTGAELVGPWPVDWVDHWQDGVECLGRGAVALLRAAGLPVCESVRLLRVALPGVPHASWTTLLLPVVHGLPEATLEAWPVTLAAFDLGLQGRLAELPTLLKAGLQSLKRWVPRGSNTPRLLQAAHDMQIPVTALGLDVFQYGQGKHAQWLDSTFTLQTSSISVKLARNKQLSAARLRQAGLPVPAHRPVSEADEAVRFAGEMGYPVVIKPTDLDGGKGVAAGLESDDEVRMAFARAHALSNRVLVEQHIYGRDYRLTVLDGCLLWAIERIPAGVTGDGEHSVEQLLALENAKSNRGEGAHAALKRIVLDDEARHLLLKQGFSPVAIPPRGQFVALRRIANVATGGQPVAVNDRVHPDNARLAVRAAQALRLDLAGVDLLIPDIARSWRETGAAICEVNAQPQLGATTGPHLYGEILQRRLGGEGRVPVVVVLGEPVVAELAQAIVQRLQGTGHAVGWCDPRGAGLDAEWLAQSPHSGLASGQMLLTHPGVEALVFSVHDDEPLRSGLPVDRIDWLVLAGTNVVRAASAQEGPTLLGELLVVMLPACRGRIVRLGDCGLDLQGLEAMMPRSCTWQVMTRADLLGALMQDMVC